MVRLNILKAARIRGPVSMPVRASSTAVRGPSAHAVQRASSNISRPLVPGLLRSFSRSTAAFKGITPDSENPQVKDPEPSDPTTFVPADISTKEYHELSEVFIEKAMSAFEDLQEVREDVDVEYSAGVLNLVLPPHGTYVINKQPPNKQIWLSSPVSGPKHYDWVILGETQNNKEDTARGEWISLRDGSSLSSLLEKEIGIDLAEKIA